MNLLGPDSVRHGGRQAGAPLDWKQSLSAIGANVVPHPHPPGKVTDSGRNEKLSKENPPITRHGVRAAETWE